MGPIDPPAPLASRHDLSQFSSCIPVLDGWLRSKARLNEARGGARTYVACDGDRVVGFYSLAASAVERRRVSSRLGRNMPDPIPVILLGQLAVDKDYRGRRLGTDLLVDAGHRALAAARMIGARAVIVQAIDERVKAFYVRFGYRPFSEREPLMMILRMAELEQLVVS
ncbi:MAG: GNAT family N-acetyltransferase [Rhodobacteraceae bacterium]|nr:GNAT family N-acetyltransferase [Paracoccaceae bacterium]